MRKNVLFINLQGQESNKESAVPLVDASLEMFSTSTSTVSFFKCLYLFIYVCKVIVQFEICRQKIGSRRSNYLAR